MGSRLGVAEEIMDASIEPTQGRDDKARFIHEGDIAPYIPRSRCQRLFAIGESARSSIIGRDGPVVRAFDCSPLDTWS